MEGRYKDFIKMGPPLYIVKDVACCYYLTRICGTIGGKKAQSSFLVGVIDYLLVLPTVAE